MLALKQALETSRECVPTNAPIRETWRVLPEAPNSAPPLAPNAALYSSPGKAPNRTSTSTFRIAP